MFAASRVSTLLDHLSLDTFQESRHRVTLVKVSVHRSAVNITYGVQCTVYSVQCTVYSVQTGYSIHPRPATWTATRGSRLGAPGTSPGEGYYIRYDNTISGVHLASLDFCCPRNRPVQAGGSESVYKSLQLQCINRTVSIPNLSITLSHIHPDPEEYLSQARIRDSLERVSCSMNKQEFYEKFIRQRGWD